MLEGLLDNYCYTAKESPDGLIWICTWKGVSIYDPVTLTTAPHPILTGEAIRDVLFYEDGAMVATSSGIRYIRGNGVYPVYLVDESVDELIAGVVNELYFDDATGLVWFTVERYGALSVDLVQLLRLWEMKDSELQREYERIGDSRMRESHPELYEKDETLKSDWLKHSLFILDGPEFRRAALVGLVTRYRCAEEYGERRVKRIRGGYQDEILVLSANQLCRLENGRLIPAPDLYTYAGNLEDFSVETGGELFLSGGSGLTIISADDTLNLDRSTGLSSDEIVEWEKDRQGIVWIVTGDGILHKLASRALRIYDSDLFPLLDGMKKSLPLPDGGILLGGSGGLMVYRNGKLEECRFQPDEEDQFIDFSLDSNGDPVIVTEKSVILLQENSYTILADDLRTDSDRAALTLDYDGLLWIVAGWEVMTWDGETLSHPRSEKGEIYFSIFAHSAPDTSLFFGTWRGFYKLKNNKMTKYTTGAITEYEMGADSLTLLSETTFDSALFEDEVITCGEIGPDSAFWFGTFGGGLIRLDGDSLSNFTMEHGSGCNTFINAVKHPSGEIYFLGDEGASLVTYSGLKSLPELCDFNAEFFDLAVSESGDLLFATSKGCLISGARRRFLCNRNYGLNTNKVTGIEKVGSREYLLLQDNGFTILDLDSILAPKQSRIPLVLNSVSSGGKNYPLSERIELDRGMRSVHLEFALNDFLFEQDNLYSFRLTGLNEDFSPASPAQEIFYPHLPPGEYQIEGMAWNGSGVLTEFKGPVIELPPLLRETQLFKYSVLAVILMSLSGVFLVKIRKTRIANILLREEVEETGRELQQAKEDVLELRKLIPICSHCKNVRNDTGYWQKVEDYLSDSAELTFTHGICPDCVRKLYPELE